MRKLAQTKTLLEKNNATDSSQIHLFVKMNEFDVTDATLPMPSVMSVRV